MIERLFNLVARRIDGPLMAALMLAIALGLTVIYSASGGQSFDRVGGQVRNVLVALGALWIAANVPPQTLMRLAVPVYVVGMALLVGVAVFGDVRNGARRWLNLGFGSVQPSEIMKIAVPLVLAWYFHRHEEGLRIRDYAVATIILALPVGLIARQPDLGTALLIFASGFFVIFLAGLSWKLIVGMGTAGLAALPFLWSVLHDYQRKRILTLLDPMTDPLGAGYHIIQSTIAIGSGGLLGKGWLNGTQAQLDFLPERSTDFIFAVFGEEFGLAGIAVLIALYVLIIARGLMIAASASTTFSRLLAGAVTLTFFTYAFVNMGMVTGILPVVGVPLPLISYGGTALLSMLIGFGILMSVATHKQLVQS
ncbi:Peptidoglycan glycosyltransferase MrdB [Usitatibacter rugosus]|uniref:Peptidoglycan glycosyltransferase MrdB n=1 Tax=Usitatibacter rugosus TaxID=2732067 RepID=A0A6M4H0N7_9PROT|nr:rod shape-determining protein RodA [Usitatibacter rugosus]QJR13061.1 Peptidoglycan glycosyltransferase MrdB [Usitatibacter rugosus]